MKTTAEQALEFIHSLESEGFTRAEILGLMTNPKQSGIDFNACKGDLKELYDEVKFICRSSIKSNIRG